MDNIKIIKLKKDRWEEYKKLRLEALENAPTALTPSYEDHVGDSDEKWQKNLEKFSNNDEESMWFLEVDGKLVGMAGWKRIMMPKIKHRITILAVYLKPENRGKGLAKKLLIKLLEEIEAIPGIVRIDLDVNTQNEAAINLYKNLGFEITGTLHKELFYEDKYYDVYEMEKLL